MPFKNSIQVGKFLLLLACFATVLNTNAENTNEFFPIMAWNSPPADLATLKKMRECGLTVAGFVSAKNLDLCEQAGLKALVSDPRVSDYDWKNVDEKVARKNLKGLLEEVGNSPTVYGYYLRDEPSAELFPGLGKMSRLIRELAPGKWPYINLFPNYATPKQLDASSYTEYLEKFNDLCQPTILSYDHYALMDDGTLRDGYWQNLEQMRDSARKHHLPFWNIVLAVAHFNYREPTGADLRFEVYSTLAYGGRGIAYFTYFAPQVGNYRMAAIDQFGNETATWRAMQNVNLQVAKLAPTLLALESERVYHFGTVPEGSLKANEATLVKSLEGDFMAGDFKHEDESQYVLIVNKDVVRSHYCNPTFQKEWGHIQMVSPYTGELTDFSGEQKWLAPGQGVLLKLK